MIKRKENPNSLYRHLFFLNLTVYKMKSDSCHEDRDANFAVTGGTGGRYDDLRCHQWRQIWHHDNFGFSVEAKGNSQMLNISTEPSYIN